jgi:hypothetical protein
VGLGLGDWVVVEGGSGIGDGEASFFVDKGGACVEEVRKLGFRMFDG